MVSCKHLQCHYTYTDFLKDSNKNGNSHVESDMESIHDVVNNNVTNQGSANNALECEKHVFFQKQSDMYNDLNVSMADTGT